MATLLTAVIGAEAAVVTNNNAAAVLVSLASLCAGREVIISRGELIEIGGRFRIPDVMAASGAKLVEVGTTNRTHLRDYEDAIRPDTAAILKVHRSNYQVVGFTAEVDQRSLGRLARGRGVAFLYDIGSGLIERGPEWTEDEPTVVAALEDGADLVMFSADKLLGGPQAGIVAGRSELVERVSNHPLMRAVRPDKLTLAALQATLLAYLENDQTSLPIWQMTAQTSQELERRATSLSNALRDIPAAKAEAVVSESVLGGGSLPGSDIPSWAVAITHESLSADDIGRALRSGHPPVIARIEDDRLLIDMRCAPPGSDDLLTGAVRASLR
jgi:L-seryl-tRNA(Ser) seleniumtransferase